MSSTVLIPGPAVELSAPEYVSAERLAVMFDPPLSIGFIRSLQKRRVIPATFLGRRVLFSPAKVRGVLESQFTVKARLKTRQA